jgi:ADP-dependent NAD(P)H-hydrate dehydratase / NAD(P)H-hydrate epimerase
MKADHQLLVKSMFQHVLPPRDAESHKGSCGSVAVIGGDEGMVGAVLLAARSALFSGAGRVYASMLSKSAPAVDLNHPEIMIRTPAALAHLKQLDCVAIGPGLGQSIQAIELLISWLTEPLGQSLPMVLDADALNLIAEHAHLAELLKKRHAQTIITPHAGEAARLLGVNSEFVQGNRDDAALKLAKTFNVICVLKGADSVCAYPNGVYFINTTGNPALASGGTGDVLTGLIASLVAQGVKPDDAVKLGVFAHGLAADNLVAGGTGPRGLTASEVLQEVRNVLNQLNQS